MSNAADLDGISRRNYFRSHPIRRRGLDPAVQAKAERILAIAKKRDALRKVQEAARRIQIELEHRLEQARRAGGAEPGWLLTEIKRLRFDLDQLEI